MKLRTARADEKSEAIAATIIGYIRGLALGSPFVPYGATSLVTPDDSGMTAYVATTKDIDGGKRPEELSACGRIGHSDHESAPRVFKRLL